MSSFPSSWRPPPSLPLPQLTVYNSLTRTKVPFVTASPNVVTWYNCGPTVYDAAHMGHARNYLTQDVMRRILRDYFGYEVWFVMNITDVDDKIIVRARQSHLINEFVSTTPLSPSSLLQIHAAWSVYTHKVLSPAFTSPPASAEELYQLVLEHEKDTKWADEQRAREEKWSMYLSGVGKGLEALKAAEGKTGPEEMSKVVEGNRDAVGAWLDKEKGASITDPSIFRSLAAYWETSYFNSMSSLHIERPTTLTRVSEYIPEIVAFVERLVAKGQAYESGGSVWFDTGKFDGAEIPEKDGGGKHEYAKLQPWSKGNRALLEDGEGSLTQSNGKCSASDFALWKASKPGEPSWPSPWGGGRPGWHIECSVMASAVLGKQMDVHSGGVDLMFPHHDNELAQSEAFHDTPQWVSYFLHTGHLHIEGLKMSKSLKNFITIDEALEKYTARQLRLAFLGTTWNNKMDFKESAMESVRAIEGSLNNFFANANALITEAESNAEASDGQHHFAEAEHALFSKLYDTQHAFRVALCDSFDTPKALQVLLDLVSATNIYLSRGRKNVNAGPVEAVAEWTTRMLRMFGLGEGPVLKIGWGLVEKGQDGLGADKATVLMPYLRALSSFRDSVRKLAREGASAGEILALTDKLRDAEMVELGVALDDQEDGRAKVKLVSPELLRAARDEKLAAAAEKEARKAEAAKVAEEKRREKLEKGRVAPADMFKQSEEWSEWDEEGVPIRDKEGADVPKSRRKKLLKEWEAQKKLHDEFLKAQA